jgi:hypothetical protein
MPMIPTLSDDETIEIDAKPLAQFILWGANEYGDWKSHFPEGIDPDDVWREITARNVTDVDYEGDGVVAVEGKSLVHQVVDYIPASGGGRFEPPINPPEYVTEEREVWFSIRYTFEDEGFATGEVEIV